ncbi:phage baseplate assembly protein V [Pseudoxanthobacter soli DSM 19599]|uniref:Phage baseplate assembly protein V n=1 Tax=Pseudoxanthobacter soli DSM 19599 TaxID=1123029 RepID=A0A1M7ZLN1_9HYPH|nr:phage baseplate assembly protein [Pseudoxanthobacter soli]SHO65810.1 phage baseplate assembly protein V [Pseudoxanthobacter soli DSM 19599]
MTISDSHDRVGVMLRRMTLSSVDDSGDLQTVSGRTFRTDQPTGIARLLEFGFGSHPPEGSQGLVAALGGRQDRLVALGIGSAAHRPRGLQPGHAVLYDAHGNAIRLFGERVEMAFAGHAVTVTLRGLEITAAGDDVVIVVDADRRLVLGGDPDEHPIAKVITEAGPALNVWARTG